MSHLWDLPTRSMMLVASKGPRSAMLEDWIDTGSVIEPDNKKRVALGKALDSGTGVKYRVMKNALGQILLDPVKMVPAYEAWVWENPERIASIKRGIAQAEADKLSEIDLSKYEDGDD